MPSQEELTELVRNEVRAHLTPLGWSAVASDEMRPLIALRRALDNGLDATVTVSSPMGVSWGAPVVMVHVIDVGVGYRPLSELATLTREYGLHIRSATLYADGTLDLDEEEDDDDEDWPETEADDVDVDHDHDPHDEREEHEPFKLNATTPDEVREIANQIAEAVIEHGSDVAERYANVDELIAAVWDLPAAALLSATGRFDESDAILDRVGDRWRVHEFEDQRRCAYQLRRWNSSGGDRSLLPAEPPPRRWPKQEKQKQSFGEMWSSSRKGSANRDGAHEAARKRANGLPREEQLAILAEELNGHDLPHSPIDVELALDHLWETKADQWTRVARGAVKLGLSGVKMARAARGNEPEAHEFYARIERTQDLSAPDPAFFEVPTSNRQSPAVDLHQGIDETLAQIHDIAWPKPMNLGFIQGAWLTQPDQGEIAVHVGEWEIGTIASAASAAFEQALTEAAFREEFPKLAARIAFLGEPRRYLVDVALPLPW